MVVHGLVSCCRLTLQFGISPLIIVNLERIRFDTHTLARGWDEIEVELS